MTINQNFSPIPQIYIPNTTILTKNNFWKISQFSRKTYIVCKIATRIENRETYNRSSSAFNSTFNVCLFHIQCFIIPLDFSLFYANFTRIPQIYTHRATNLPEKIFQEISLFSMKTYIACNIGTKMILLGF